MIDTRAHWVAVAFAVLTAIATVLTAWFAYQSARWNGVQAISFGEANASRSEWIRQSSEEAQQLSDTATQQANRKKDANQISDFTATPVPAATVTSTSRATTTPLPTATSTRLPTSTPTLIPAAISRLAPTSTSTPVPTATTASTGPAAGRKLIFDEEFDGTSLDTIKWRSNGNWGIGIGCQDSKNDIAVSNGRLHLIARNGQTRCSSGYSNAIIQNDNSFAFRYGYAEARVNIPKGAGLWSAFWLYGEGGGHAEIDAGEWLGQDPNTVQMSIHYADGSWSTVPYTGPDWSNGWHTIGVDWKPGLLVWYVDGTAVRTVNDNRVPNAPMYVLADIAVGGSWAGDPNSSTVFPADFSLDYIRVYSK